MPVWNLTPNVDKTSGQAVGNAGIEEIGLDDWMTFCWVDLSIEKKLVMQLRSLSFMIDERKKEVVVEEIPRWYCNSGENFEC